MFTTSRHPGRVALRLVTVAALSLTAAPAVFADAPSTPVTTAVVLPAPTGLKATRDPQRPNDFTVSWSKVAGDVHHYNVSVYARGHDAVRTVAASQTSLRVTGIDLSTVYRITVSSRDVTGSGSTSGPIWLWPAVPSAPSSVALERDPDGAVMVATWKAPLRPGYTAVTHYEYSLTQLSTTKVVAQGSTDAAPLKIDGLDPQRQYVLRVTAVNTQGKGVTAIAVLGNDRPGSPAKPSAVRATDDPKNVDVTWAAPAYHGYAPIDRYEVLFGVGSLKESITVKPDVFTATVPLDAVRNGLVAVRACSVAGCGQLSTVATVAAIAGVPTNPETATTNPMVDIAENNGVIRVEVNGVIGSTTRYPRLVVRVLPSLANGGFTDAQWGQNGAQLMTFETVPSGTYTVTVHGVTAAGAEIELARKLLVIGSDGATTAADWKVVFGRATISGNTVDMPNSGENRVLSTRPRTSTDMVLTTTATLRFGWGYGIWFRAGLNANGKIDGYTFQYDPMYGNKFLLRIWNNGTECSTPLATKSFPAGFQENVPHLLTVVASGDTVWATVDGKEVFRIDSLSAALASSGCRYALPKGTGIGFRTWSASSAVFQDTTLR